MSRSWPVREPGQAAYERLRTAALAGTWTLDRDAARFERGGLRALIVDPVAAPLFVARLVAVPRPPWSPYADPRIDTLAEAYQLLTATAPGRAPREAAG
jgi:hypothetical protein